jgi:hypothetical protein
MVSHRGLQQVTRDLALKHDWAAELAFVHPFTIPVEGTDRSLEFEREFGIPRSHSGSTSVLFRRVGLSQDSGFLKSGRGFTLVEVKPSATNARKPFMLQAPYAGGTLVGLE